MLYGESTKKTVELLIPQVVPPEDYSPGISTWYNTVCGQCSGGCGISVRIREGRAKKIEGNPAHPVNQGRLCARGQAGLNALYNPDRIKTPLKRSGERGSGQFVAVTWEEALGEIGKTLESLKSKSRADRVVLVHDGQVAETGRHEDLVRTSDLYRHWEYTRFNAFGAMPEPAKS